MHATTLSHPQPALRAGRGVSSLHLAAAEAWGPAGFALGVVALVVCWLPWVGLLLAVTALVLATRGLDRSPLWAPPVPAWAVAGTSVASVAVLLGGLSTCLWSLVGVGPLSLERLRLVALLTAPQLAPLWVADHLPGGGLTAWSLLLATVAAAVGSGLRWR